MKAKRDPYQSQRIKSRNLCKQPRPPQPTKNPTQTNFAAHLQMTKIGYGNNKSFTPICELERGDHGASHYNLRPKYPQWLLTETQDETE